MNIRNGMRFWILLVFGFIFIHNAYTADISDSQKKINFASEVLGKSMLQSGQGTGTAKVSIYTGAVSPEVIAKDYATGETHLQTSQGTTLIKTDKEYIVDFAFKGPLSKTEMYKSENGQKGKLVWSYVYTPERTIVYNNNDEIGHFVAIGSTPNKFETHYRKLGYDFHPDTFINYDGDPEMMMRELKEGIPEDFKDVETKDTEDGLFIIEFKECNNPGYEASGTLTLDPKLFFRPVSEIYNQQDQMPHQRLSISEKYEAKWENYDSIFYVTNVSYENIVKRANELPYTQIIKIEIVSFDSKTTLSDSYFTSDNMNIPEGTEVNEGSNKPYKYKTSK